MISRFHTGESWFDIEHNTDDESAGSVFYEIFELKIYESSHCCVEPGDVIIDGGAHYGFFAVYALIHGADKVHCFEANPNMAPMLARNVDGYDGRIIRHDTALWDSPGILAFRSYGPQTAGSRIVHPGLKNKIGDVFIPRIDLDSAVSGRVDLIKLDIEGSELQALVGMEKTIKRYRPKLMVSLYHRKTDSVRLPKLIESFGMDYKHEISTAPGKHITGFFY